MTKRAKELTELIIEHAEINGTTEFVNQKFKEMILLNITLQWGS
jgi:hypothetical protein